MHVLAGWLTPTHDDRSGFRQLLRYLPDQDVTVERVGPLGAPRWVGRAVRHRGLPFTADGAAARLELALLRRHLRPDGADVVHLLYGEEHWGLQALALRRATRRLATVATFHHPPSVLERTLGRRDLRQRFAALDVAVTLGPAVAEHLVDRGLAPERVHVVLAGTNAHDFTPPAQGRPDRSRGDGVSVLAVGSWLRDLPLLRDTLATLYRADPSLELVVLGDASVRAALAGTPGVDLPGRVDHDGLVAAYRRADVLLHAIRDGVASVAIGEALATGLPVVGTQAGETARYAGPDAALLVAKRTPDVLADAVLSLVEDPARRRRMGAAARLRALELDWPHHAWMMSRLYRVARGHAPG